MPSAARAGIASLLVVSGTPYLVDAGEGVVRQLSSAGFAPPQIRTIFITHHHVDHQADLPSLVALSWFGSSLSGQRQPPVQILGPPSTQVALEAALNYLSVSERTFGQMGGLQAARSMFNATDIRDNAFVYDDGNVRVTAVENTHYRHPSVAPDGVPDRSLSFRFDTPSGSLVFTGDTGPSDALVELAKGADVLVSEISMQFVEPPLPEAAKVPVDPSLLEQMRWHHTEQHLTPGGVGQLATAAGVRKVVLTHLVPGGKSSDASRYAAEVRKHFSGEIVVGEDLMAIPLGD
jgi:ribonuclease BN (tRNA processing enzyme)